MSGASVIHVVLAVIRDARGHVLLVRKHGATVFQQPGGKPDPADADDIATLARELREELGCTLVDGSARLGSARPGCCVAPRRLRRTSPDR